MSEYKTNIIFIGSPGVGKSTILNGLIGDCVFESGLSIGSGKTSLLQKVERGDYIFIDTPGLNDIEKREQAALEISKAFQEKGLFKIIFVFTLEDYRAPRIEDVATMNIICDSIHLQKEILTYGIIVNKLPSYAIDLVAATTSPGRLKLLDGFNKVEKFARIPIPPDYIYFNELVENLSCTDNGVPIISDKLHQFIFNTIPSVLVSPENVDKINTNSCDYYRNNHAKRNEIISEEEYKIRKEEQRILAKRNLKEKSSNCVIQ